MFDHIKGTLSSVSPTQAVIDCNGVGYLLYISLNTYSLIKEKQQVKLLVHLIVREDAQELYGFATDDERLLFRQLISVSGVGASTARVILSSMQADELRQSIANGDAATLQRIKGIGSKTAQRIIIDLREKVLKTPADISVSVTPGHTIRQEALSALLTLGFAKPGAEKAIENVVRKSPQSSVEQVIKEALSML